MKNTTQTFGGYYNENGYDSQTKVYTSRVVPAIRRSDILYNVTSSNNFNRATNKIVMRNGNQTYTHDVNNGTYGGFSYTRSTPYGTDTYNKSGDFGTDGGLVTHVDRGSYNDAVSKLGDVIRGGIDLSIDAFQVGKTIELAKRILSVRKIVEHLAYKTWKDTSIQQRRSSTLTRNRAYADVRHRFDRHREMARLRENPMKDMGALHLEFTYGLKPTLQTIHDIVTGKAQRAGNSLTIKQPNSRYKGVTGRFVDETNIVDRSAKWTTLHDIYRSEHRTKIGGTYTPSNSYIESLSRLTSLNPVSIAWELVPFSFVVDWFYDVGGYLRMAETALVSRLGVFDGYKTTTIRYSKIQTEVRGGKDPSGYIWTGSKTGSFYRQIKQRSVITSVPYPRPPVFRCDLGSTRMINAAALLSQFLGRK